MNKTNSKRLSAKQKKELKALARLSDDEIDTQTTPEARNWKGAKRGIFYGSSERRKARARIG
jgi:transposase